MSFGQLPRTEKKNISIGLVNKFKVSSDQQKPIYLLFYVRCRVPLNLRYFHYILTFSNLIRILYIFLCKYIFMVVCSSLPPTPQSKMPQHQLIGEKKWLTNEYKNFSRNFPRVSEIGEICSPHSKEIQLDPNFPKEMNPGQYFW